MTRNIMLPRKLFETPNSKISSRVMNNLKIWLYDNLYHKRILYIQRITMLSKVIKSIIDLSNQCNTFISGCIIGGSGIGKSTLIGNMFLIDLDLEDKVGSNTDIDAFKFNHNLVDTSGSYIKMLREKSEKEYSEISRTHHKDLEILKKEIESYYIKLKRRQK